MKNKYKLIIKTNSYVGNFERELCGYVFGFSFDFTHDWTEDLIKTFNKEVEEDYFLDYLYVFHDEHGQTICEISNNCCNDLIVHFQENPIHNMPLIKERIEKFPKALAESWEFSEKNLQILGVELFEEKTATSKLL